MGTELRMEMRKMRTASLGKEACVPDLSGESILQNQLRFHLPEDAELYEGYGRVKNAYPYRQRNGYNRTLKEHKVQTVVLENRYLKAVFLPEYGGRLWELWDKEKGKNLLYTNDVIRFSNLAVRNAWFSGGVEWNIGVIGHTPFTTEQMYVAQTEDDNGNAVLRMYEYERIRDVTYQMDFWLEEDSRFLNCRMRIVNENSEVVPMYWWSNIAVPEFEGGRVIVPAKAAYTTVNKEVQKVTIPMVRGVDVTDYKKIPKSVDYFFEIEENMPKYIANVNAEGYGLLQMSTGRLKSRKLFSWGSQKASDHWQEFLTENAGRYIEIQAGLAKTQYGCIPMAPNTSWEWMEQYGAIQIEPHKLQMTHEERSGQVTEMLLQKGYHKQLEEKLKASKPAALKKAELIKAGSGYGILGVHGDWTSHLEFVDEEGDYSRWKAFVEGGRLHSPKPEKRPDVFLNDAESFDRLKEAVKDKERNNWYAHFHLGVRYSIAGRLKKAEREFKLSIELEENAWAFHGLASLNVKQGEREAAIRNILKGMKLQKNRRSYQKEGFKILLCCEAYAEVCSAYEKLSEKLQADSRLRFYYIKALGETGRQKEAYTLLEEDGGLVLDDIREGEESLGELWKKLHDAISEEEEEVPYKYQFMAFE